MNLTRTKLLEKKYNYPKGFINLKYSRHFQERVDERCLGFDCMPTMVKITEDNIHSAKTIDNKTLSSVVVKLKYNNDKYVFIAFNPFDGGAKSFWFQRKNNEQSNKKNN